MMPSCENCIYTRWNVSEEYVSGCENAEYMTGELVDQQAERGYCSLYIASRVTEVEFDPDELEEDLPF